VNDHAGADDEIALTPADEHKELIVNKGAATRPDKETCSPESSEGVSELVLKRQVVAMIRRDLDDRDIEGGFRRESDFGRDPSARARRKEEGEKGYKVVSIGKLK
jgi:hypothetical protein